MLLLAGWLPAILWAGAAAGQTSITVTPTDLATKIAIGGETRERISLRNSSTVPVTLEASVHLPEAEKAVSIEVRPEKISLSPGETGEVELTIKVPDDAPPGRQAGLVDISVADGDGGNLAIAGNIRVTVEIDLIIPVSAADFDYPHLVGGSGPVSFGFSGRNTGEFPANMRGTVELESLFGDNVELRHESGQIAHGDPFEMKAVWDDPPLIGLRKMKLSLSSGVGAPVTKTSIIVIFSWKLIPVLLLVIAGAYWLIKKNPAIANVFQGKWRQ